MTVIRPVLLSALLALASSAISAGKDIYVAASAQGANNGVDCADAHASSFFNSSSNWGAGASQIGPGTTVHICGTITGATNATLLTFQGSGTSGNPITLLFETGAIVQSPACNINGCIFSNGNNYIVIDGGTNGIVRNTLNGTSGAACSAGPCSVQQDTQGINLMGCTGCTIQNLTVAGIYVRTSTSDGNQFGQAIQIKNNTVSGATNVTIQNNVVHDASNCIFVMYGTSDSGLKINGNEVYNCNWLIAMGSAGGANNISSGLIHDNKLHDTSPWDDWPTPYNNHHNYIAMFNGNSPSTLTGMVVYNNEYYGNFGSGTSTNYLDNNSNGNSSATYFNNYIHLNAGGTNGGNGGFLCQSESGSGSVTCHLYNNTDVGVGNVEGFWMQGPNVAANIDIRNNIIDNWATLFYSASGTGMPATMNYNDWFDGTTDWQNGSTTSGAIASWRSASGLDMNSVLADPLLNTDGTLQSGSPAIALGTNLTSLCTGNLTPLCTDKSGRARPTTGSWSVGAFQFSVTNPNPPTQLTLLVQ